MTRSFVSRPRNADAWVKAAPVSATDLYTARLTIDITPQLRGRIKILAIERGLTVAEMLRSLLEREYGAGGTER
jgi:hypothetical protein